jgi:hypothetical protein
MSGGIWWGSPFTHDVFVNSGVHKASCVLGVPRSNVGFSQLVTFELSFGAVSFLGFPFLDRLKSSGFGYPNFQILRA